MAKSKSPTAGYAIAAAMRHRPSFAAGACTHTGSATAAGTTSSAAVAGHIGHTSVRSSGFELCGCGRAGCLETVASGTALARQATAAFGKTMDSRTLIELARCDPLAERILVRAASSLAEAIANAHITLDLQRVVVGGSVGLAAGMLARIQTALERYPPLFQAPLVAARLGADSGLIGAALWAEQQGVRTSGCAQVSESMECGLPPEHLASLTELGLISELQKDFMNVYKDAPIDIQAVAAEVFATLDTGRQIEPFSARIGGFGLDDAYRVTAAVRKMRETRGELPVGRKIGFTNRTIWSEYNVYAPIWGYLYNRTVHHLAEIGDTFSVANLVEPRIEPEIVFSLAEAPTPDMDERTLLASVDWVAHGFEIVQSIFPGWRFAAPDTVAAFGLHGALLIGPPHPIAPRAEHWSRALSTFAIDLKCDDKPVAHGHASNVLGGPVSSLRHLVELLSRDRINPPLAAGEIVTTGTLTRALPVAPGETWTTELTGISLDSIRVRFVS
jgi:2-oxo-3-hexenedioate decarboxylase